MIPQRIKKIKKQFLNQQQIEEELINTQKQDKLADFSNKTLSSFSIFNETINTDVNFDDSEIEGQVFLGDIVINGDLSFKNCLINGSLYLANVKINGNLILENAKIEGAINLVGAEIQNNLLGNNLENKGFLSLAKAKINGNVFLEKTRTKNVIYDNFTVKGDLIMEGTIIGEDLNLKQANIESLLDMDEIFIGKDLILEKTSFNNVEATNVQIKGKTVN